MPFPTVHAPSDISSATLPLFPTQRAMLAGMLSGCAPSAWNIAQLVTLEGPVDVKALQDAIRDTTAEMDALRVKFEVDGGTYTQRVLPPSDDIVDVVELPSGGDFERRARALAQELSELPWDLAEDRPLTRHTLITAKDRVYWVQRGAHAIADGYAGWLMCERSVERYNHTVSGAPLRSTTFPRLRDVADNLLKEVDGRAYWRDYLAGAPDRLSPANDSRPVTDHPHRHSVVVPESIRDALGQTLGNGMWTYPLIAAVGAFVAHISEEREAVIGTPVLGRFTAVEKQVPTIMMSVTPVRVAVHPGEGLHAVTERVLACARATRPYARARPDEIFEAVPRAWRVGRFHGPLVNLMPFAEEPVIPGVTLRTVALQSGPVYDLLFTIHPSGDGSLVVECQAHRHLYTEQQNRLWAERLAVYLQRVSRPGTIVADADTRLPEEIRAAQNLARPCVPTNPRPFPAWGGLVDLQNLQLGVLEEQARGWQIVDRLGRPVGWHQVGELVALAGGERRGTGMLVHEEPDGRVISHGPADQRRLVYGRYVEAPGVAAAIGSLQGVKRADVRWDGNKLRANVRLLDGAERTLLEARVKRIVPAGSRLRVSFD